MNAPDKNIIRIAFFTLFLAALPLLVQNTMACTICVPYPQKTLADRLLEHPDIIFAREVPDAPYRFYPVETVRGTSEAHPFNLFCQSSMRRKLQAIPSSGVVLVRSSYDEEWQLITFADVPFQSFIRSVITRSGEWGTGSSSQSRFEFFSRALSSDHPDIQEQAFLEVGRAPYSMIKKLAAKVPRHRLYALLRNYQFVEWHNLYILILGQSRDPADQAYIRDKVESAVRFNSTTNLAAWLTAFIETDPERSIAEIEKWYFHDQNRTREELLKVQESLSTIGSQPLHHRGGGSLRAIIIRSYETLLKYHPAFAGFVAKDLAMWQVNAHTSRLSAIRSGKKPLDPEAAYLVDYYLSIAKNFSRIQSVR